MRILEILLVIIRTFFNIVYVVITVFFSPVAVISLAQHVYLMLPVQSLVLFISFSVKLK